MTTKNTLDAKYPNRTTVPLSVQDIPRGKYVVYILTFNDKPIVLGHGKHNRAKVIFDDQKQITSGHIKALFVRAYRLFGNGSFEQFIIECDGKNGAKKIEGDLHQTIGGNSRDLLDDIKKALFNEIQADSLACMVLRMALCSSFDGISDLKLWRSKGILDNEVWDIVGKRLQLDDPKK